MISLGKGKCLVKTNESQAVLQVAIAPSPFELMRDDNRNKKGVYQAPQHRTQNKNNSKTKKADSDLEDKEDKYDYSAF
ncbi:hypothetical protein cce_3787 [Crocosphaera subtropica ATCC 51142]|uniref:Uncharacterized protein n=1 Tax=Crocosphaera subtropica (strain ATCC 51142 / BH68) TaxID=43989 RepID=B1WNV6_CROS5|nr:hypothetical protein [Crocosphaera subtropica]ACB53135.1 hypothetical protein cce_3787 [Crocosphaera subtropica ATCC 51142]